MARCLKVVLASVGSRGDIQPMLALAQALVARGHAVTVAAPPDFQGWITGLGWRCVTLGVDMQAYLAQSKDLLTGSPLRMLREVSRYFKEQIGPQAQQLKAACAEADVLVYGGLASLTAPSVAECLRIPALGVQFTTALLPSSAYPPPAIPWRGLPGWLNRFLWWFDRCLGNLLMRGTLNAMRADLALPPVPNIHALLMHSCPIVLAADEVLLPPDPQWQGQYPYAGFLFFEDPTSLRPELDAWLDAGEPPVFVGFGSMSGHGTDRVGRMIIAAVKATGRRCIVGAGWAGLGAGELPSDWCVVREAPHALLFPRVAVVVHHGGSGTTAQALRAGVPQVILPLILDQFHHAHLLYLAGLVPPVVPMEKVTTPELTQAIVSALALPEGPRLAASRRLKSQDGGADLAVRVELLMNGPQAVQIHSQQ